MWLPARLLLLLLPLPLLLPLLLLLLQSTLHTAVVRVCVLASRTSRE
jgi:hypothetical protein